MTIAGRKYIAIPIDGLDVFELSPVVQQVQRLPRQTEAYVVHQNEPESQVPRIERSNSQIMDYVDFGAQTGNNGAFSWFADYPVNQ
ncbi:uncharacterized protein LOC122853322 isoform X2 [Aphidius gifuensis]|nr:uncharacterized protein LOC122853322 isoform X2 [Aphidius gifuensis]